MHLDGRRIYGSVSRRTWQDHRRECLRSGRGGSSMNSGDSERRVAEAGEVKWLSGRRNRRWGLFCVEKQPSWLESTNVTRTNTISDTRRSHPSTSLLHILTICGPLPRRHRAAYRHLCSRICRPSHHAIWSVQTPLARARMDLYAPQDL